MHLQDGAPVLLVMGAHLFPGVGIGRYHRYQHDDAMSGQQLGDETDSGDLGLATQLLDAAHAAGVPLTIFAVGRWLDDNPQMARRILDGGHELANHTYTHPALGDVGATAVADEIVRCRDALTRHAGGPGRWFRPSGIEVPTPLMLTEAGRAGYPTVVGYDLDPRDYQDPGAQQIVARVRTGLHAGAIVSLHTGHAGTVTAFPGILDAIAAARLKAVTVHQLLER